MKVETTAEQLFFTTVLLEGTGGGGSKWTGTGFVVSVPTESGDVALCLTNRHVLEDAEEVFVHLLVGGPDGEWSVGEGVKVGHRDARDGWVGNPNDRVDVAAFPLGSALQHAEQMGHRPYFRSIPVSALATHDQLSELDAIENVVFVGYPAGLYDTANLTPILRTGVTATPVALDYRGVASFLIDASVFPGSSGSPVFLLDRGMHQRRDGGTVVGNRFLLLGVLAAGHHSEIVGEVLEVPSATVSVAREMIDLGIVFKASTVLETIDALLEANNISRVMPLQED